MPCRRLSGPEAMIESCKQALLAAGVPRERIHAERFLAGAPSSASPPVTSGQHDTGKPVTARPIRLSVTLDGKVHELHMAADERILDVALAAGLDLPYSCKGGVCCTCRAKVLQGEVVMEKNFTLEAWEVNKGFVLSCQARPLGEHVTVSYDDR